MRNEDNLKRGRGENQNPELDNHEPKTPRRDAAGFGGQREREHNALVLAPRANRIRQPRQRGDNEVNARVRRLFNDGDQGELEHNPGRQRGNNGLNAPVRRLFNDAGVPTPNTQALGQGLFGNYGAGGNNPQAQGQRPRTPPNNLRQQRRRTQRRGRALQLARLRRLEARRQQDGNNAPRVFRGGNLFAYYPEQQNRHNDRANGQNGQGNNAENAQNRDVTRFIGLR